MYGTIEDLQTSFGLMKGCVVSCIEESGERENVCFSSVAIALAISNKRFIARVVEVTRPSKVDSQREVLSA